MSQGECDERSAVRDGQSGLLDDFRPSPIAPGSDFLPQQASYVESHSTRSHSPCSSTNHSDKSSTTATVLTSPLFTPQYCHFPRPSLRPLRSSLKKSKSNVAPRPNTPSKHSWLSKRSHERGARHVTFLFPDGHRERSRSPRSITSSVSSALERLRKLIVTSLGLESHSEWTKSAGSRGRDLRPELGFHKWSVDEDDVISLRTVHGRSRLPSSIGSQSFLDLGDSSRGVYFD